MKLVFCLIARHYCLELPFIVYSILKQCWSVGYVSLLTLSFVSGNSVEWFQRSCTDKLFHFGQISKFKIGRQKTPRKNYCEYAHLHIVSFITTQFHKNLTKMRYTTETVCQAQLL